MNTKSILIVGAGSVGSLIGASLVKANLAVTFVGRSQSNHTKKIKQAGITLSYSWGEKYRILPNNPQVRFFEIDEELTEIFDIIIVAVKSNNLAAVAPYIRDHSHKNSLIFHAQNGIPYWWFAGNNYLACLDANLVRQIKSRNYLNAIDPGGKILKLLGDRTLVGCVVKAPCGKTKQGLIEVKKPPKMLVGLVNAQQYYFQKPTIHYLCSLLSNHGLTTSYTEKIRTEVCQKLAINLATNVLAALTGCAIADLTANPHANNLIATILAEIKQVFLTYGIEKSNLPSEDKVYDYITEPGSQKHLPSLAQDFACRQLGEINLITAPVEMAEIAGINTPIMASLAKLLQFAQTYALNTPNSKFNILTFEHHSGYCLLNNAVYQSHIIDRYKISELVAHLIQINIAARNLSCQASVA